jgi:hypothetical protein
MTYEEESQVIISERSPSEYELNSVVDKLELKKNEVERWNIGCKLPVGVTFGIYFGQMSRYGRRILWRESKQKGTRSTNDDAAR